MKQSELVLAVHDALVEENIPYLLAGSFATMAYGVPRSTKDVDFVIELSQPGFDSLVMRLEPLFSIDPQQQFESLAWTRRYILTARKTPFKVELFIKGSDPHHDSQWGRRKWQNNPVLGRQMWMPTAEDVVIQKIRWGRQRDQADVLDVMSVQAETLDWAYVEHWCDQHGTRPLLEELRASIPPL